MRVTPPISEERAVLIGFWTVTLPTLAIMIPFMLTPALMQRAGKTFSLVEGGFTILVGIIGGWVWWSLAAPRWRLWAYRRVSDLDRLKALAVAGRLIWPDQHVFTRTEIRPKWLLTELTELERSDGRAAP